MEFFTKLLTGGFLAGYRTYLLGFLIFAQAAVQWAIGDSSGAEFLSKLPEMLAGLGLMTLRAGIDEKKE